MRLLETLEALTLGLAGKLGLWRALEAAAEDAPSLRKVEYDRLVQRAEEQHRWAEAMRLEAARKALVPGA